MERMVYSKQILLLSLILVFTLAQNSRRENAENITIIDESWGLFKPHLLFGITQRSLNPLNFGMIYTRSMNQDRKVNAKQHLRWKFGNKKDGVFADYISNNGYDFAEQKIIDYEQQVDMQMTFIKNEDQQWGVDLKIQNKQEDKKAFSLYLYLSASTYESSSVFRKKISIDTYEQNQPIKLEIEHTRSKNSPDYLEIIENLKEGESASSFELKLLQINTEEAWNMQQIVNENIDYYGNLENSIKLENENNDNTQQEESSGSCEQVQGGTIRNCGKKRENPTRQKNNSNNNVAILKISNSAKSELNFFIRFTNSTLVQQTENTKQQALNIDTKSNKPQKTNGNAVLVVDSSYFDGIQKFEQLFKIKKDKFKLDLKQKFGYEKEDLIQSTLSNLLGGIVFYHGRITVRNSLMKNDEYKTVFSASPSRKIFPRAFLWDEGFHDVIICMWNEQLCKSFIHSWLENQDVFGYISREQVRTSEISLMVPDGFRSQDAYEANPPTLLLPILSITQGRKNVSFLQKSFRKLEKWFKWFTKTQSGLDFHNRDKINRAMLDQEQSPHYRWQCKGYCTDGNFMGSGLDDYPRQDPLIISKQHLDLQSWMIFFAESLETLSLRLNNKVKQSKYGTFKQSLLQQLQNEFLDHKSYLYKDIGAKVFNTTTETYITHLGYITLYPLMFNAIPQNSLELITTLDLLYSKEHLWTDYGIRSLSLKDPLQETGDNYWRGAIWMPLNFLILRSLKLHYFQNEKARTIYHELRDNLIQNVYKNWKSSGYLYETYNPNTGQGQRGFPFNGWTSLIVLIIKQDYE